MNRDKLIERIRSSILKLDCLGEAEAIGIFGSLVSCRFKRGSDIDIFIVVKEKREDTDMFWYRKIKEALHWADRGVTVLVYSVKGLIGVSNWYVLRLAKDGLLLYDKDGKIKDLFERILKKAEEVGIVEEVSEDGYRYFALKKVDLNKPFVFTL